MQVHVEKLYPEYICLEIWGAGAIGFYRYLSKTIHRGLNSQTLHEVRTYMVFHFKLLYILGTHFIQFFLPCPALPPSIWSSRATDQIWATVVATLDLRQAGDQTCILSAAEMLLPHCVTAGTPRNPGEATDNSETNSHHFHGLKKNTGPSQTAS